MKNIIISVIVTACVMVTGFFVYTVVKMQSQVNTNTATVNQIVTYLNNQIQKANPGTTPTASE